MTKLSFHNETFNTVKDAISFLEKSDHDDDVTLTDGKGNTVKGREVILRTYRLNNDMWSGDKDCIHLNTSSGWGGGCHCDTCPAWFCY